MSIPSELGMLKNQVLVLQLNKLGRALWANSGEGFAQ